MGGMFVLLLKEERPGLTSLNFVGCYPSKEMAQRQVDRRFGPLEATGLGNSRMLEACGSTPAKSVRATRIFKLASVNTSYVLAEY